MKLSLKNKLLSALLSTGFAITAAITVASAQPADPIRLGYPDVRGTGCPAGTASASLSPDQTALSILFDSYVVEAGELVGGALTGRKNCDISVPLKVPQGYAMSIIAVDYRGFVDLPKNASATFSSEYFFAGYPGPKTSKTFVGTTPRLTQDYFIPHKLTVESMVWSACGADVNLRIRSTLNVRVKSKYDQAQATLDSIDMASGIIYQLQFRSCF